MEGSTVEKVVLGDVDLSASGSYKCKVVGEFPDFPEAEKSATMMVVGKLKVLLYVVALL